MSEKGYLAPWRTSHCMLPRDLFASYKQKYLDILTGHDIKKELKALRKIEFVHKVFCYALKVVVDDIIDNGTQFNFSSSHLGDVVMFMDCVNGERFKDIKKKGGFKDFDPIKTNFSAYGIKIAITRSSGRTLQRLVHLDKIRKHRIIELAHNRAIKCGSVKHYPDYYNDILKVFPFLSQEELFVIMRFGFNSMARHLIYGLDIFVHNNTFFFMTGMTYPDKVTMLDYVRQQLKRKIAVMYRKLHYLWDGYLYFLVDENKYNAYNEARSKNKKFDFGNVRFFKVYDMAVIWATTEKYLFKIKNEKIKEKFMHIDHLETDDAEFVELIEKEFEDVIQNKKHKWLTIFHDNVNLQVLYQKNLKEYLNKCPKNKKSKCVL